MMLWKLVSGMLSPAGLLTALSLGMVVWPTWLLAQDVPPEQAASTPASTPSNPIAATPGALAPLEARLQRIEAALEMIVRRLNGGAGPLDRDPNHNPVANRPKPSTLQPLTSLPATEFTRGEGAILQTAGRRYEIIHDNGRSSLHAIASSHGTTIWQGDLGIGASLGDKASWQLSETEDGKLLRLEATGEDSSLVFTIDTETGRTVKQEISSHSTPRATISGLSRVPLRPTGAGRYRSPPPPGRVPNTPQDQLVWLATSYVDAIGHFKLARSKYEQLKALRGTAAPPANELETAAINLETTQQKVAILTNVVEAAAETALTELEFAERMFATGFMTPNQVIELRAKVKTLEAVLQQRNALIAPHSLGTPSAVTPRK